MEPEHIGVVEHFQVPCGSLPGCKDIGQARLGPPVCRTESEWTWDVTWMLVRPVITSQVVCFTSQGKIADGVSYQLFKVCPQSGVLSGDRS